jgi:hypothetical protein
MLNLAVSQTLFLWRAAAIDRPLNLNLNLNLKKITNQYDTTN